MAAALDTWYLVECLENRSLWLVPQSCISTNVGLGEREKMPLSHPDAWLLFQDSYEFYRGGDSVTDVPKMCRVLTITDYSSEAYYKFHWVLTNALHGDGYYGTTTDDDEEEYLLMEYLHRVSSLTYYLHPPPYSRDARVGIQMPSPGSPPRFFDD